MFQEVEGSRFQTNRHMKVVWSSTLSSCRLYPQEIFLVLISVTDRIDPSAIMRPEGCQWKFAMTPSGKNWSVSGFHREVDENCNLLGYFAASSDNSLPTFRDKLSVPSRVKTPKRLMWKRLEENPHPLFHYHPLPGCSNRKHVDTFTSQSLGMTFS